MIRILKVSGVFICVLFLITGCGNYKELNKISYVLGLGIDWTKDSKYKITLQIISPNELASQEGGGGKATPVILYSSTGDTISEAARDASKKITKSKDFTHVTLMVIGEEAAKHGIDEMVDAILREPRISNTMSILVAKNTTAENILDTMTPLDQVSSMEMVSKIENIQFSLGEVVNPNIFQLGENLRNNGQDIVISGVRIINDNKEKEKLGNVETLTPAQTLIDEAALFRKGKLVGWINGRQTRAILMIQKQIEESNISIPCGSHKSSSLRLTEQKTNTNVKLKDNKSSITVDTTLLTFLDETGCSINLENMDERSKIEKKASEAVEKQILDSILTAQKYKSDVFGFGNMIHAKNPKHWKEIENQWREIFAKAKVKVKTKVFIRRNGMLSNPIFYKE